MNYNIEVTSWFARQLKRLAKKYPSLKTGFSELVNSLKENPRQGTHLGNNCYKIRIAIAQREKENQEAQELSLMCKSSI
jgi:mRNA-degrading endonuclease RelE of RelBE toxin-antitoxin system